LGLCCAWATVATVEIAKREIARDAILKLRVASRGPQFM
jgi:hypothetical protein